MDITLDPALPVNEAVTNLLRELAQSLPERVILAHDPSGEPVMPPDAHVLDALVHQHMLVDTDAFTWPALGTVAVMDELPECDDCGEPARYDQISPLPACWACEDCFTGEYLGMGKAQRLLEYEEVSDQVREICDRLTALAGRPSVFEE